MASFPLFCPVKEGAMAWGESGLQADRRSGLLPGRVPRKPVTPGQPWLEAMVREASQPAGQACSRQG